MRKKNILIKFDSSALGDNIAWIPYVEEYRKVYDCNVVCFTFFNYLFEKAYPNIKFVNSIDEIDFQTIDLVIPLGFYVYPHIKKPDIHRDIEIHSAYNLQELACVLLRLEYKEIKPNIYLNNKYFFNSTPPYVSMSMHSTAQCKYWNHPTGWEETVNFLNKMNYEVFSVDHNPVFGNIAYTNKMPKNIKNFNRMFASLQERASAIYNSDFFIGLSSGMTWLAWALNKPTILISGFTDPSLEFKTPYRLINKQVCNSCFTNKKNLFDQGDWIWCPEHKNTDRMFECSKSISPNMVREAINNLIYDHLNDRTEKETSIFEEYCKYLNREGVSDEIIEINPGDGVYTKILSKYFKKVVAISPLDPTQKFVQINNELKNVSFFKKSALNQDFFNSKKFDFVYINIDKNTDFEHLKEEVYFWKTKVDKGLGGHGWQKDNVSSSVLAHFEPGIILLFNNSSWYIKKPN